MEREFLARFVSDVLRDKVVVTGGAYSKEEMCQRASEQGYQVTPRLVLDWAGLGLMDVPERHGQGRGRGVKATWPESQLPLFLAILQHRRDVSRKNLGALCNIPVWIWLRWGDGYVPLRQVRRAMKTWMAPAMGSSRTKAEAGGRQLVRDLKLLRADRADRNRLVAHLSKLQMTGYKKFDRLTLRPLVEAVIDPESKDRPVGPPGATTSTDTYLDLIEARLLFAGNMDAIPAEEWREAQANWRVTWQAYQARQPMFVTDPLLGHLFAKPDLNLEANNACSNLCTILGLRLLNERDGIVSARHRLGDP